MKRITQIAVLLMLPVMAIPVAAQKDGAKDQPKSTTAAVGQAPTPAMPGANDASYIIGPSDELNVSVWDNAELSKVVPVRPDGKISLPLLNDVQAAGLTPMQLMTVLVEKVRATGVKEPLVTVTVTAVNSQHIYVLGKVARAGAYPVLPGMTVLQALSSAGGIVLFANERKITVLRTENGQQVRLPFNYKDVINGKHPEQNIVLKAGDTVVVP